jgi:4-hydroxy-tetrahydrodipicolinate synthase
MKLQGAYTALVTPFDRQGAVDFDALDRLVDAQIAGGIAGLVPCGSTGESATLDDDEHVAVVQRVVKRAAGRVPVIAGAGSNATAHAVELAERCAETGADAVMVVMPYYNKPTQPGLVAHSVAVARSIASKPVVLYNIPGRTGIDLLPESVEQICMQASNVVAMKEATGNVLRAQDLLRRLGDRLTVLSGDDGLTLPMMAIGAAGVISVTSNLVTSNLLPADVQRVCTDVNEGRWADARKRHLALLPVHEAMFLESNPSPVKGAMADAGMLDPMVRPPLVVATEPTRAKVRSIVAEYRAGAR